VGDVGLVAVDDPGVDAAPDPVHDELPGDRPGFSSAGPGSKSANGRENMTWASTGLSRTKTRNTWTALSRSARGSSDSRSLRKRSPRSRKPSKNTSRTRPALSPKSSQTAGGDVWARSATFRVVNPPTPSAASIVTATCTMCSRSCPVRCLALGTAESWISLRAGPQAVPGRPRRRRRWLPAAQSRPAAGRAAWWPRARPGRAWPARRRAGAAHGQRIDLQRSSSPGGVVLSSLAVASRARNGPIRCPSWAGCRNRLSRLTV